MENQTTTIINGTLYVVLSAIDSADGRTDLMVRRPNGRKNYFTTRFADGRFSDLVRWGA
jgi:hypothetical protein